MYNTFNLDKPCNLEVDPPSTKNPPLCRITQEEIDPILTTDFYFTDFKPRLWVLPTTAKNKDTAAHSGAAAATDKTEPVIEPDSPQQGEICLHSWMLYTPQAPVMDLRDTRITSTADLWDTFQSLHLCPEEDETHPG